MTRPELHEAVAGQKSKASEYNENFELMMDYLEDRCEEAEATVTNKADLTLSNVTSLSSNIQGKLTAILAKNDLSNVSTVTSEFMSKIDTAIATRGGASVKTTYVSGTSGYRIWTDGYCEQWGQIQTAGYGRTSTVSLTKIFANTDYQVLLTWTYETTQGDHGSTACYRASGKATDNFIIYSCFENYQPIVTWRVLGYLASGQY